MAQNDPATFGLQFWTYPYFCSAGNFGAGGATLQAVLTQAIQTVTIGKLGTFVETAAATAGGGQNGLAIYKEVPGGACPLLGVTGDMTAAYESTGYVEGTLTSPVPVTAGQNYYIAQLADFTTSPALAAAADITAYPVIRGHYPIVAAFEQSAFPASITPASMVLAGTPVFLTAGT